MGWKDLKYWQRGLIIVVSVWLLFFLFSLFNWVFMRTCDFGSPDCGKDCDTSFQCSFKDFLNGYLFFGVLWLVVIGFLGAFTGTVLDIILNWRKRTKSKK